MSARHRSPHKPGLLWISAAVAASVLLAGILALSLLLGQQARLESSVQPLVEAASSARGPEATPTNHPLEIVARKQAEQLRASIGEARAMLLWVAGGVAVGLLAVSAAIYRLLARPIVRLANGLRDGRYIAPVPEGKQAIRELQMLQDAAVALGEAHRELDAARAQLAQQVHTDALTGLANWRMFEMQAQQAFFHAQRYSETLSVIVLDIDHFRRINDRNGHDGGDLVLRALGRYLKAAVRAAERPAARIGGEEFAILVSHTAAEEPALFAERLRRGIAVMEVAMPTGSLIRLTTSVGVASQCETDQNLNALMRRAEDALQLAKKNGRNRVERAA